MSKIFFFSILFTEIVFIRGGGGGGEELWKKDLSSAMKIGLSTTGYKSVDLRCNAENFSVNVTLGNDFEGVIYTRGSFDEKKLPCFKRHDQNVLRIGDTLTISLTIPFTKCSTVMDVAESCFVNTIVVQHDPELIMPGDAAFNLQCAFVPEFKVSSNISTASKVSSETTSNSSSYKSKITLVNADPADNSVMQNSNLTVYSNTEKVTFFSKPEKHDSKDEL